MLEKLTILPISFQDVLSAKELLAEYAAECSIPAIGPIDPQPQIYEAMERNGVMRCLGVYSHRGLFGFSNVLKTIYPHYGIKLATAESLFVNKENRTSSAGIRLMDATEDHASDSGCNGIFYSAPVGSQFERLLDRRKQYQRTSTIFYRSL